MTDDPEKEKLRADLAKAKEIIKWFLVPAVNMKKAVRLWGREKARRFLNEQP